MAMENIGSIGHAIVLAILRLCQPLLQVAVPGFSTATYTASVAPTGADGFSTALSDSFLEAQHPQHVERWRMGFVNWIAHEDITFE
jgi:hypothetical protein